MNDELAWTRECPIWEDGEHCFQEEPSEDEEGYYKTPKLKECACGAAVKKRVPSTPKEKPWEPG